MEEEDDLVVAVHDVFADVVALEYVGDAPSVAEIRLPELLRELMT